jgi:hypothetical protein
VLKLDQRRPIVDALMGRHCLMCLLLEAVVVGLTVSELAGLVPVLVADSHQGPVAVESCKVLEQEWSLKPL